MLIQIDDREHSTIMAALRYYQACDYKADPIMMIHQIASDLGKYIPLDTREIDHLCQRINTRTITHVGAIAGPEGIDLYLGTDRDIVSIADRIARDNWEDMEPVTDDDAPADELTCVNQYFGSPSVEEQFECKAAEAIVERTTRALRK